MQRGASGRPGPLVVSRSSHPEPLSPPSLKIFLSLYPAARALASARSEGRRPEPEHGVRARDCQPILDPAPHSPYRPGMDRRRFLVTSLAGVLAAPYAAEAQPAGKTIPRIGYLDGASRSANSGRIEAFRQGLRELGYVEGQSLAIEWRYAEGDADRLRGLAAEL